MFYTDNIHLLMNYNRSWPRSLLSDINDKWSDFISILKENHVACNLRIRGAIISLSVRLIGGKNQSYLLLGMLVMVYVL